MIKYPKSECEAHLDVKTDKPVCIICMGNEIERLEADNAEFSEALDVQNTTIVDLGLRIESLKADYHREYETVEEYVSQSIRQVIRISELEEALKSVVIQCYQIASSHEFGPDAAKTIRETFKLEI